MKLNENEVINNLLNKNLKIIQRPDFFNFSLDSLLISNFISLTRGTRKILDLGTGNGAIPLFLSQRTNAKITGIEIQEISANLAKRNIQLNNLEEQIEIVHDDMKCWKKYFENGSQDAVITNPPFFKYHGNENQLNDLDQLTLARHEITIDLNQLIETASKLLKDKGYFAMVHRPDRFLEIIDTMRKYKISPKRVQFCHSKIDKPAKILLIEGIRNGNDSLTVLPPFISHDENGQYSSEVLELFKDLEKKD
ncbi:MULTISPECIES: tRNA1(Val) (adenine(37)-N6)-methyltransferase [Cetobacterium]|jgi:tRNA1(Val) A37 N6-methylase TrmN6|uniref:tRNA1(Val) (Adenine(37)-N6)-methyltransferase n=1 Tax=Candidatus Cetobacterium colombiensis TaxID=3073100 RepID=A0ABU4WD37_9FUSO|nr:tRNA1(Val) (adenine(37)-N6)-methyltransferase [Candidatus Cetobacterium colombiensis]MDX8336413.1 tRNA1(Val) (adenine(37)-N6)-methyltransferase [Candidatus Cetobacterium colombiensis]